MARIGLSRNRGQTRGVEAGQPQCAHEHSGAGRGVAEPLASARAGLAVRMLRPAMGRSEPDPSITPFDCYTGCRRAPKPARSDHVAVELRCDDPPLMPDNRRAVPCASVRSRSASTSRGENATRLGRPTTAFQLLATLVSQSSRGGRPPRLRSPLEPRRSAPLGLASQCREASLGVESGRSPVVDRPLDVVTLDVVAEHGAGAASPYSRVFR